MIFGNSVIWDLNYDVACYRWQELADEPEASLVDPA
jgi:hypothetical protein